MRYPLAIDLSGRDVVVVGGGNVATRKVRGLLEASASVRVVAPELSDELAELRAAGRLTVDLRSFEADDVHDATLAFAATDDHDVNAAVVAAARAAGVPANAATGEGDFTLGAIARRGPIQIVVWTGGSPALAVRLRDLVAESLDERWADVARAFELLRRGVTVRADAGVRRTFWKQLASGVPNMWRNHAQAVRWVRSVADDVGLMLSDDEIESALSEQEEEE